MLQPMRLEAEESESSEQIRPLSFSCMVLDVIGLVIGKSHLLSMFNTSVPSSVHGGGNN